MRPADVRPLLVDPAASFTVEERAGACASGRLTGLEQLGMMAADHRGLDLEDGETVGAAVGAACAALEAPCVRAEDGRGGLVDERVQPLDPVDRPRRKVRRSLVHAAFVVGVVVLVERPSRDARLRWYARAVLRVSVLELPARWGEPEPALDEVDRLLSAGPPDLAVVPEMALTGYVSPEADFDLSPFGEPIDGPTIRIAAEISRRHATHLVVPLVLREDGALYNAAVVVGPDERVIATYRKRHPWIPERWATAGPLAPPLFEVGGLTATIAICYDGHFLPDDAADVLRQADLLVFTSAWVDDEDSRLPLLRSVARGFGISIANANWAPGVVEVPGQGGSCVLDARGEITAFVAGPGGRADGIVGRRRDRR